MKLVMLCIGLFMILANFASAQADGLSRKVCLEKNKSLLRDLNPDNSLYKSILRGEIGTGIENSWMSKMRRAGVRQLNATLEFRILEKSVQIDLIRIGFYDRYYDFSRSMIETDSLAELRKTIRLNVFQEALGFLNSLSVNYDSHGTLFLNLLDDPCLPITNEIPTIERD
jgi:hypothetical protein